MAQGWSVDGRRIEFRAAFPAGKLAVLEGGNVVHEEKLKAAGEWQLPVGKRTFKVTRTRGFMGPKTVLHGLDGSEIPMTPKHVEPTPAPSGATCATHQAAASYVCPRCGAFCCPQCAGPDFTHCAPCATRQAEAAAKNAKAMAYMAPVPVFFLLFGLLPGIVSLAAGGASVAVARNTDNKKVQIGAAIAFYGVAVIITLVIVFLVAVARQ